MPPGSHPCPTGLVPWSGFPLPGCGNSLKTERCFGPAGKEIQNMVAGLEIGLPLADSELYLGPV